MKEIDEIMELIIELEDEDAEQHSSKKFANAPMTAPLSGGMTLLHLARHHYERLWKDAGSLGEELRKIEKFVKELEDEELQYESDGKLDKTSRLLSRYQPPVTSLSLDTIERVNLWNRIKIFECAMPEVKYKENRRHSDRVNWWVERVAEESRQSLTAALEHRARQLQMWGDRRSKGSLPSRSKLDCTMVTPSSTSSLEVSASPLDQPSQSPTVEAPQDEEEGVPRELEEIRLDLVKDLSPAAPIPPLVSLYILPAATVVGCWQIHSALTSGDLHFSKTGPSHTWSPALEILVVVTQVLAMCAMVPLHHMLWPRSLTPYLLAALTGLAWTGLVVFSLDFRGREHRLGWWLLGGPLFGVLLESASGIGARMCNFVQAVASPEVFASRLETSRGCEKES